MNDNKNPTFRKSWQNLAEHFSKINNLHMGDLFAADKERFNRFSLGFKDILLDYSKNIITQETMDLLVNLTEETGLRNAMEDMFTGIKINKTENRAVLHTALRDPDGKEVRVNNVNVKSEIKSELEKIRIFSEKIRSGTWKGYTGKSITDIVNIGIGGSDLGSLLVNQALEFYGNRDLKIHFVSNVDPAHLASIQDNLNPETTLFITVSKSFTTQETLTNTVTLRDWFVKTAGDTKHLSKHFILVSKNNRGFENLGFQPGETFTMWNFVGGRYSIWSAVGLSLACYTGYDHFLEFLEGAREMDEHFRTAPFHKNLPVILALLGIWYNNFFKAETQAILPYDHCLRKLPAYLQQCHMESNGKNIDRQGNETGYHTCPIIWGETGTNSQHSFFQLLHQGTRLVPADFLAPAIPQKDIGDHHHILLANFLAQTEALMTGKTKEDVLDDLKASGLDETHIQRILPFNVYKGNRPTNTILYKKLSPRVLGSLMAMYEHKVFAQGHIWNIFSFDQWGVELGKKLAREILGDLETNEPVTSHDSSTNGLINLIKKMRI